MSAQQIDFLLAGIRNSSDEPVVGGTVYAYAAGTTTPKYIYLDKDEVTPAYSVTLDTNGKADIYGDGWYKFVIKDSAGATLYTLDSLYYGVSLQALMSAQGDMVYASAAYTPARLGIGTALQVLQTNTGATAPQWAASPQSVLNAAGAMLYASSANVLAKLAVVADRKIFGNAAGTAPEYATGIKIGTFTRAMDATGADVSYTGVGFKPSLLIFIAGLGSTSVSVGFSDAVAHYITFIYGSSVIANGATFCINLVEDGSKYQQGLVKSMDANGFTITWTKGASPASANGNVYYIALR